MNEINPCIRCGNPTISTCEKMHLDDDPEKSGIVTIFVCGFCALEHTIKWRLHDAIEIWNAHPRPVSMDTVMRGQLDTMRAQVAAIPSRLERLLCALVAAGRVPLTVAEEKEYMDGGEVVGMELPDKATRMVVFAEMLDKAYEIAERANKAEAIREAAEARSMNLVGGGESLQ